ncbi:MAG: hypothetical protein AB3N14_19620 [Flavobacteriaceae bacterium]
MKNPTTYEAFIETLVDKSPGNSWPSTLKALWWDAKGDWHTAHDLVDGSGAEHANWVHAYLHRKEGDRWNAGYWYRRANRPFPEKSLEQEWEDLVEFLVQN